MATVFLSAPRYYVGGDTPSQARTDEFTAQGLRWPSVRHGGAAATALAPSSASRATELLGRSPEDPARRMFRGQGAEDPADPPRRDVR